MLLYSIFILICLSASAAAKSFPDYRSQNSLFDRNDQPIQCGVDQFPPPESDRVPRYIVNLDLPPEERWNEVMDDQKLNVFKLLQNLKNFTSAFFHGKLFKLVDKYLPRMAETLPEPYLSELKGVARAVDISLGEITLYNIFYEVFSVCTSLISQGEDGKILHARNLDFGLFLGWDIQNHTWETTEILRPLVVEIDYQRNNQTVYKSVNFAGYVGVLTGMKPQRFTLTLDERFSMDGGFVGIIRWLMGDRSAKWAGFLMRDVLEQDSTYQQALSSLSNAKLLAPVYFIVSGNSSGQGAIITRGRKDAEVWHLGSESISQKSTWYLIETNYDHWEMPPFYDDRRTPAIHCFDEIGQQNVSLPALYNILSTKPVLNQLTTYTSLMDVSIGRLETWLRYCPPPCNAW